MERELLLTGVGGQGVQLAAQVLARAATREGRQVMLFGSYGGAMRGGNSDSTLIVADEPIVAPPIVSRAWSALAMHHEFFEPLRDKLVPAAVVLVNSTLFEADLDGDRYCVVEVPATRLARELGSPLAASLVMAGAYAAVTGLVTIDSLLLCMRDSLPAYRRKHAAANEEALRAGFACAPHGLASAWAEEAA